MRAPAADSVTQSIGARPCGEGTTDTYVPVLLVSGDRAFRWAPDDRARFLLGFVDGRTPVFELLERTGMPLDDGVEALVGLYEARLVGLSKPATEAVMCST